MANNYDEILGGFLGEQSATPKPQGGNEYDAFVDQYRKDESNRQNLTIEAAKKIPAERAAQSLEMGAWAGVDPDMADRNQEAIGIEKRKDDAGFEVFRQTAPLTAQWATENPHRAAAVMEDFPVLSKMESLTSDYGIWRAMTKSFFKIGLPQAASMMFRAPAGLAEAFSAPASLDARIDPKDKKKRLALAAAFGPTPFAIPLALRGVAAKVTGDPDLEIKAPPSFLDNTYTRYYDNLRSKSAGEMWEFNMGWEPALRHGMKTGDFGPAARKALVEGMASAPNSVIAMLGFIAGGAPGMAVTTGAIGAGVAGETAKEAKQKGLPSLEGQTAALGKGTSAFGTEFLGNLIPMPKWIDTVAKTYGKTTATRVLRTMANFLGAWGTSAGTEGVEELADGMVSEIVDKATGLNENAFGTGFVPNLIGQGLSGFAGGSFAGPFTHLPSAIAVQHNAMLTQRAQDFYTALGETVESSKIAEKLPRHTQEIIKKLTQDGPLKDVYIAPNALAERFSQSKNDLNALLVDLDIDVKTYDNATKTGTNLKIPLSNWIKLVKTDHYAGLANDIKFSENEMSVNELKEFKKRMDAEAKSEAGKADVSAQKVYEDVRSQLEGADRPSRVADAEAQAFSEWSKQMARIMGVDPYEFYKSVGLQIARDPVVVPEEAGADFGTEFDSFFESEKVTEEEAPIQDRARNYARTLAPQILEAYGQKYGNEVNTDLMRDFLAPVGYTGENANAYHAAASALQKMYQKRLLARAKEQGKKRILILAGGPGSGKSSTVATHFPNKSNFAMILDGTLSDFNKAKSMISGFAQEGFNPQIVYIYRDPVEAWVGGVLARNRGKVGRVVPAGVHIRSHAASLETAIKIHDEIGGDAIMFIDNSRGYGNHVSVNVEEMRNKMYTNRDDIQEVIVNETLRGIETGDVHPTVGTNALAGIHKVAGGEDVQGKSDKGSVGQSEEELRSGDRRAELFAVAGTNQFLQREQYQQGGVGQERVLFEVAPDPNNKELSAQWNALSPERRQEISNDVATKVIPKVLESIGVEGSVSEQLGGYLDSTNQSFALLLAPGTDPAKVDAAIRNVGFVLSQDSVMAVGEKRFPGAKPMWSLDFTLPSSDYKTVSDFYNRLRKAQVNGVQPVTGHTTIGNTMSVIYDESDGPASIAEVVEAIKALGIEGKAKVHQVFVAFVDKGGDDYGLRVRTAGNAASEGAPVQGNASDLRAEASRFVEEGIRSEGRPAKGGVPEGAAREVVLQQSAVKAPPSGSVFYSQLQSIIEQKMPNSAPVAMVRALIDPAKGNVKAEEVEWSGINEFLEGKERASKAELLDFLKENQVQVKEVVKGDIPEAEAAGKKLAEKDGNNWESLSNADRGRYIRRAAGVSISDRIEGETKFSNYQLPGGENYREVLLTLPVPEGKANIEDWHRKIHGTEFSAQSPERQRIARQQYERMKMPDMDKVNFHSSHFDEPNILAHVRMNDRYTSADGTSYTPPKKILFLEEIQSDWHQKGRDIGYKPPERESLDLEKAKFGQDEHQYYMEFPGGEKLAVGKGVVGSMKEAKDYLYKYASEKNRELAKADDNKVPNAPFKKTWHELALKRMLRYAVDNGYDGIAWTTGEQQTERYWGNDLIAPAVQRFVQVTKPESVRKLAEDVFGREMASAMPLDVVDGGVLAVLKKNQVRRAVIKALPADVVDILSSANTTPEELFGNPKMVFPRLPVNSRNRVAIAATDAIRQTDATLRAKLRNLGEAGREGLLLPALKAGDLNSREVAGLLSPESIFHLEPGPAPKELASARTATEALSSRMRSIENAKIPPTELAQLLNAHASIIHGREGLLQQGFEVPPGAGMKGFYDGIIPSFLNKYTKKWGGRVGEIRIKTGDVDQNAIDAENRRQQEQGIFANLSPEDFKKTEVVHSLDITPAMRESVSQGQPLFQAQLGGDARGQVRFGAGIINLDLFRGADRSTVIHEFSHIWLKTMSGMYETLKSKPPESLTPIQQQFIKDAEATLGFLGVTSFAEIQTEHHEKWARAGEAYFMEGRAPSAELRGAFARFRAWLIRIYRQARNLGVELTDDVRGVFDRLLASQEAIDAARRDVDVKPLFENAKEVGMSDAQAERYARAVSEAELEAEDEMANRVMAEMRREETKAYVKRRAEIEAEVAKEVDQRKEQIALSVLQRGTLPNGDQLPPEMPPIKLSLKAIRDIYGEGHLDMLPEPLVYSRTGGSTPDEAAVLFGFRDGKELLDTLETMGSRADTIQQETDARLKAELGDPLDESRLIVAAVDAVHNDKRAQVMKMEMEHLVSKELASFKDVVRRVTRPVPSVEQLRHEAREIILDKTFRDLQGTSGLTLQYKRAESRASREAVELMLKGDFQGAFDAKLRERMNHELYRAAAEARDKIDDIAGYMAGFQNDDVRARIGKAGGDYLDQIDALLERYEFKRRVSVAELDRRRSLLAWRDEQIKNGYDVQISDKLLNEARRVSYKEVPYDELLEMAGLVENIEHLSGLKNKLLANKRARTLDEARDLLVSSLKANFKVHDSAPDLNDQISGRVGEKVSEFVASHRKIEFIAEQIDGKPLGPAYDLLVKPFLEAAGVEEARWRDAAQRTRDIFSVYPKEERALWYQKKVDIPGIGQSVYKPVVLAIALNQGNPYNQEAFLAGLRGLGGQYATWTQDHVMAVLNSLDARDIQVVNDVWQLINSLWPDIESLEKRVHGLAPEKVRGVPMKVKNGTLNGGYYPIRFNTHLSSRQEQLQERGDVEDLFGGQWAKAMTEHGFAKERTNTGGKALRLDLGVFTEHMNNVIHDITHREAVIDVWKIITDPEVQGMMERTLGRAGYKQFRPWVRAVAGEKAMSDLRALDPLLRRIRTGATVVNLGYKLSSALVQTLGYTLTTNKIGPKYAMVGLKKFFSNGLNFQKTFNEIAEMSPEMRDRLSNYDRDVRDAMRRLNIASQKRGWASVAEYYASGAYESFFYAVGMMDLATSIPTWLGAYHRAMDGHTRGVKLGDHARSVEYADKIVRTTQSANRVMDLAQVQRGSELWKLFTMFYSQMSIQFNTFYNEFADFAKTKDVKRFAAFALVAWFGQQVLEGVIRGRGPDDDDEWFQWMISEGLSFPLETMIFARDIVSGMKRFGYEPSPAFQAFENISRIGRSVGKMATGDKDDVTRGDLRAMIDTVGYFAGLPTRQVWQTLEYFTDWLTGEEEPSNPFEGFWRGLVIGKPKK